MLKILLLKINSERLPFSSFSARNNKKEAGKQYKNDYLYAKSNTSLNEMKARKDVSHNQINTHR